METNEQDANLLEQSSVSNDDKSADSSQQQPDEKQTSLSAEEQAAVAGNEESSTETGDNETDNQQQSQQDTDAQQAQDGEQNKQTELEPTLPPVIDKEGDDKIPFNAHPRWKEVIAEKNEYKQENEQLKPAVDQSRALNDFLVQNQIPPAEFQATLQYLQALRTDPAKAHAMIKPTYERLAGFIGERLDPDLQAEVAAGTLMPERGVEIQRARAQQQWNQWRQQSVQQTQQSGSATVVRQAINSWQQMKTQADIELKEGTPLWEQVNLRMNAMPQFQSAEQAWQGAEKAYTESKAFLAKFQSRPKPVPGRRPPQSQATQNSRTVIKSSDDVIKLMMANGGRAPTNIRYS